MITRPTLDGECTGARAAGPGRGRCASLGAAALVLAGLGGASPAAAQEAMYTAAATMPSPGVGILRQQVHFWRYGSDPVGGALSVDRIELLNTLQLGLVRDVSLTIESPLETRLAKRPGDQGTTTTTQLTDVDLMLKWRLFQSDPGGVDTRRFAVMGGARLRTDEQFGVDPHVGAVYTQVMGLHGFNAELHAWWNTRNRPRAFNFGADGDASAVALNLAYVLRIWPARYTSETQGAWYVTAEANTLYETSGDWEVRFSPGLMYEGRRWGFEIMAQVPMYQRVRHRAELDWGIGIGYRLIF
jgi:hypothetical protein